MGLYDEIERLFRDFVRYTGDGLANEPVGAPLPTGDPASGVHNPRKADFRDAFEPLATAYDNLTGRFLGTENVTINVPSDEATIQEALDAARGYLLTGRYTVTVNIETGVKWDADTVTVTGNMLGVTITSDDEFVYLPEGFPDESNLIHFDRCVGLKWGVQVDMERRGSNGIYGDDAVSTIWVNVNSGVDSAGGLGNPAYPTGACFLFWGKAYWDYNVETQEGVRFRFAKKRNNWSSYGANLSGGKYADLRGGGTSPTIEADDSNDFNSRGTMSHHDNAKLGSHPERTSYKGPRVARSYLSARDAEVENVDGNALHVFELGIASMARTSLNGSGRYVPDNTTAIVEGYEYTITAVASADWTSIGGPASALVGATFTATAASADISALGTVDSLNYAVASIRGSTPQRPQGGGWACLESATYHDAKYVVGEILAPNGGMDLNNGTGTGLLDKLADNSGGELHIWGTYAAAAADSRAEHLVQTSNNGTTEGLGTVLDGNSVVPNAFRFSQGGKGYLRGASLYGFTEKPFVFADGGGELFLQDLNVSGVDYFQNGVYLRAGTAIASVLEAKQAVGLGWTGGDGETFTAGGFQLGFKAGADLFPGVPGVAPDTQLVEEMTLYVSTTGTGDGLTSGNPCSLSKAKIYARSILGAHRAIVLTLALAAGTYSAWQRFSFNAPGWAFGNSTLVIEGPDVEDGIPTATISGGSQSFLYKNDRVSPGPRVIVRNLKFTGFTTYPVNLKYGIEFLAVNCPCDSLAGFASLRRGPSEILGADVGQAVRAGHKYRISTVASADWSSIRPAVSTTVKSRNYKVASVASADWTAITGDASVSVGDVVTTLDSLNGEVDISAYGTVYPQSVPGDVFVATATVGDIAALGSAAYLTRYEAFTDVCLVFQDCYYRAGNEKLSKNEQSDRGIEFVGDADNPGHAIQVSRGSLRGYVVGAIFTWCDGGIQKVKGATVRTQGCDFDGFKRGAVFTDSEEGWDNDDDHLDTYRGADENHPVLRYSSGSDKHLGGRAFGKTGFQTFNGPQMTFTVADPIWTSDITDDRPYKIAYIHNDKTDWSAIGGPNPAAVGDIFTTTTAIDPLYNFNDLVGETYGKAYRLLDEIDNGRVCQIADVSGSTDWSSVGGPNPASVGDFFISTAPDDTDISALGYTYQEHRGVTAVANGSKYAVVAVVSSDWSSIGGPGSATVGTVFTATSDNANISALGVVVPMRMDITSQTDGGDTVLRPFRLPGHFFLSKTAYLEGSMSIELGGTGNATTISVYISETKLWSITLPDISGSIDRWSIDWKVHGMAPGQGKGSYKVLAFEEASSTLIGASVNDGDAFNSNSANNINDVIPPKVYIDQSLYTGEFRFQSQRTDGSY